MILTIFLTHDTYNMLTDTVKIKGVNKENNYKKKNDQMINIKHNTGHIFCDTHYLVNLTPSICS